MYIDSKSKLKEILERDFENIANNLSNNKVNIKPFPADKPMNYIFIHRGLENHTASMNRVKKSYKEFMTVKDLPFVMIEWDEGNLISYELFEYIFYWHGPEIFIRNVTHSIDSKIRKLLEKEPRDFTKIDSKVIKELYKTLRFHIRIKDGFSISEDALGKICLGASSDDMGVLIPRCDRGKIRFEGNSYLPEFLREKRGSGPIGSKSIMSE